MRGREDSGIKPDPRAALGPIPRVGSLIINTIHLLVRNCVAFNPLLAAMVTPPLLRRVAIDHAFRCIAVSIHLNAFPDATGCVDSERHCLTN